MKRKLFLLLFGMLCFTVFQFDLPPVEDQTINYEYQVSPVVIEHAVIRGAVPVVIKGPVEVFCYAVKFNTIMPNVISGKGLRNFAESRRLSDDINIIASGAGYIDNTKPMRELSIYPNSLSSCSSIDSMT